MTYGILIKNANGNIQIDSDSTGRGFIVTDTGTSTSPGKIDADREFVFARPSYSTGNYHLAASLGNADSNGKQTLTFVNKVGGTLNCDWIKAIDADTLTASTSGRGMQIFNENGDLAFDTGAYTGDGGIGVTDFAAAYTLNGDYERLDPGTSKYGLVNSTMQGAMIFNGFYYSFSPTLSTHVATAGIYFHGEITININVFGGGTNQVNNLSNLGGLLLAEGGSV